MLAAVAIKCLGGDLQCRLAPKNEEQRQEVIDMGCDPEKILHLEDLAAGEDLTFTATGVLDGPLLQGVTYQSGTMKTYSVVMRVETGTVRFLETIHKVS